MISDAPAGAGIADDHLERGPARYMQCRSARHGGPSGWRRNRPRDALRSREGRAAGEAKKRGPRPAASSVVDHAHDAVAALKVMCPREPSALDRGRDTMSTSRSKVVRNAKSRSIEYSHEIQRNGFIGCDSISICRSAMSMHSSNVKRLRGGCRVDGKGQAAPHAPRTIWRPSWRPCRKERRVDATCGTDMPHRSVTLVANARARRVLDVGTPSETSACRPSLPWSNHSDPPCHCEKRTGASKPLLHGLLRLRLATRESCHGRYSTTGPRSSSAVEVFRMVCRG